MACKVMAYTIIADVVTAHIAEGYTVVVHRDIAERVLALHANVHRVRASFGTSASVSGLSSEKVRDSRNVEPKDTWTHACVRVELQTVWRLSAKAVILSAGTSITRAAGRAVGDADASVPSVSFGILVMAY